MLAPAFPLCFPDADAYSRWVRAAKRAAQESASPCDDCTHEYRVAMQRDGRCDPRAVSERFRVQA